MKLPGWIAALLGRRRESPPPEPAPIPPFATGGVLLQSFPFRVERVEGVRITMDTGEADDDEEDDGDDTVEQAERPAPAAPPSLPPGRQTVSVVKRGPLGKSTWTPEVPAHAQSAPWSQLHLYPKGAERQTDYRAPMANHAPPLSLICVGCDLEQPPLYDDRKCPYCGINLFVHGPVVFWWRDEVEVPEWKP